MDYQDRVMLGSDPFYRENQLYWDEANPGWDHLEEFIGFHRQWLSFLPAEVAAKVRYGNAVRFFQITLDH